MMKRNDALAAAGQEFDLCIIGGGATGAGCALDAQLRGLKTLLIEGNDFASATSSASTKLIHGGIRYLREAATHFDFGQLGVVKRALQERVCMLRNAPFLAGTMEFVIPCYSYFELAYFGVGVKSYDLLAGTTNLLPSRRLNRQQVLEGLPSLRHDGLVGAVSYTDGQFDDAGFNLALVRSFVKAGGIALNHARVAGFQSDSAGKLHSATVVDEISHQRLQIRAHAFVNATGPASDQIRSMANQNARPLLKLSKGAHLLFPLEAFGSKDALLIPKTSDSRVIFAIPWIGRLLVGTTDDPASGFEEVVVSRHDVQYLLDHVNRFLRTPLTQHQIVGGFAGIRPLLAADHRETKNLSRDHKVEIDHQTGLISILGGKWTTYRAMAEDTINAVELYLQKPVTESQTRNYSLAGSRNYSAMFCEELVRDFRVLPETARHLVGKLGTNATHVLELVACERTLADPIVDGFPAIHAEIIYAIRDDMAMTIEDILARRIGIQFYSWNFAIKAAPTAAHYLAAEFGWSDEQRRQAIEEYVGKLQRMKHNAGLEN